MHRLSPEHHGAAPAQLDPDPAQQLASAAFRGRTVLTASGGRVVLVVDLAQQLAGLRTRPPPTTRARGLRQPHRRVRLHLVLFLVVHLAQQLAGSALRRRAVRKESGYWLWVVSTRRVLPEQIRTGLSFCVSRLHVYGHVDS